MYGDILEVLKRAIVARRSRGYRFFLMLAWIGTATAIRLMLDRGAYGVPFLTFYPVVLLCAIFLGGWYAALSAVLCAVIVSRVIMAMPWFAHPDAARIVLTWLYVMTIGTTIVVGHLLRMLVQENDAHIRQAETFNLELQHRTKNALQIVRALVARASRAEDPVAFHAGLPGRIDALAKANELLRFGGVQTCGLRELVETALEPFDLTRFCLTGPDCRVGSAAATPLVMALHELGTNAIKYGALSGDGLVCLEWSVAGEETGTVVLCWREEGGPPVEAPSRRGLGSRLLVPNGGLQAVDLDFKPEGVVCKMSVAC